MRKFVAVAFLLACSAAYAEEVALPGGQQCVRPSPGQTEGACKARLAKTLYESKHLGDQWIDCEEMSGTHGTAGFGVASFFVREATPYWNGEIHSHLLSLKQVLPKNRFAQVKKEQARWEHSLPKMVSRAQKNTGGEGGTLAMYVGSGNAMLVVRSRALVLACMLEELQLPREDKKP